MAKYIVGKDITADGDLEWFVGEMDAGGKIITDILWFDNEDAARACAHRREFPA